VFSFFETSCAKDLQVFCIMQIRILTTSFGGHKMATNCTKGNISGNIG